VDADIQELSADRRFITAYNAALQLATIVLRLAGFRTNSNKAGHHRVTIDALPEILGPKLQDLTDYLNACRMKRHMCDYTNAGEISVAEVSEFIAEVKTFRKIVIERVKKSYPQMSI
jgi:hypothetical protein